MFWRSRFEKLAAQLRIHDIPARIALWDGSRFDMGESVKVVVRVLSSAGLRRMVQPSFDSPGSAYIEGLLDVEGKLEDVFDVAARLARYAVRPVGRFGRVARSVRHTRKTDAEAIAYHYDVSNDFYRLWLDENTVYSCAYFRKREDALEQAQSQKLDHVLRKIRVQPGQRLPDIGCGWGALILRAVQKFDARDRHHALAQAV
jgi:cyclopropane-fatty-acyl-phospholipid synthase